MPPQPEPSPERCIELLQQCREQNLIQVADNAQFGGSSICNCCSSRCETLIRGTGPWRPSSVPS